MPSKSFRLTEATCKALVRLATEQKRSQTAVVEWLVQVADKQQKDSGGLR